MDATTFAKRTSYDDAEPRAAGPRSYALGYSDDEFARLQAQGALFRDLTEDVLRRAGLAPGMQVLDIGCGVGDVSLLAADLVGRSGAVLGIDRSEDAVNIARQRAAAAGHDRVFFAATELNDFSPHENFDAIIGRLILAYLPDPAGALQRLRSYLRPGGIIAFQEMASLLVRSIPEGPTFRRCREWILETFERTGFELDMGGKLFATFLAAGLPAPQMIAAGRVEGNAKSPVYDYLASTLRSLLPMTERVRVATAEEVDVDTFARRLRQETVDNDACIMLPPLVGAWTRVPAVACAANKKRQRSAT